MQNTMKFALFAVLGMIVAASAQAESQTAAKVNGIAIPQELVDFRIKATIDQGQPDSPELREAILKNQISMELMSQEAIRKGLDKQSETVLRLELARQEVLVGAYAQDYAKTHPISEESIAREYENLKASLGDKEYSVQHILVATESEAKSLAAKLKKGAKFDKLAQENSKDPSSKAQGGSLGWIPVGRISGTFVKSFGDALLNLNKGQVSPPVQSQFGWHLIRLEDVRDSTLPPLDELRAQIIKVMAQQAMQQQIDELRSQAKIE